MLPKFQSAYRSGHSAETALLRVLNDIRCAVDNGRVALVTLLDLSAAFDTIDHDILLSRLKKLGISSTPLKWLQFYLSGRTQRVAVEGEALSEVHITCGVPQGSILGPILYSLCTVPLSALIDSHHLSFHLYADDTMIFTTSNPDKDSFAAAKTSMERCCVDVKNWMAKSRLRLNADKTEFIIIGSKSHLQLFP